MKKAIIYVKGHKQEMQEILCRVYAIDNDYKVLFVTTVLKDVNNCDVLLVANHSRISRNRKKYYTALKDFKEKGIELINVASQDNAEKSIMTAIHLFK